MSNRDAWLEMRRTGIGGSDAAAIMGESPWGTPLTVFNDKLGLDEGKPESAPMEWGKRLERVVASWYRDEAGCVDVHHGMPVELGVPFGLNTTCAAAERVMSAPEMYRSNEHTFMLATPDLFVRCANRGWGIGEVKTANAFAKKEWFDGDTCRAPRHYWWQVQHYMAVMCLDWGVFPVLFGGADPGWVDVDRDDAAIKRLITAERELWARVQDMEPPDADGHPGEAEQLGRMHRRSSGKAVDMGHEALNLANCLESYDTEAKACKLMADSAKTQLRALLGDASEGRLPDGRIFRATDIAATKSRVAHRKFKLIAAPD